MKSLISINRKFMDINLKDFIELINNSKYTKGVELYIDIHNDDEIKYLNDLIYELKKYNLILQIHGNSELDIKEQIKFLKLLENISDYLEQKIVVTLHSIYNENKELSLILTKEYISKVANSVDNEKVVICLENLNDVPGYDKLEKEYIRDYLVKNKEVYFTYDIGHEIADYGNITNLDNDFIKDIRNIHIHTNDGKGNDHQPIYLNDSNWNKVVKGIVFLINNNYQYNIVYEYDLYACHGETKVDKVKDYLSSIDLVSEHYN